MKQYTDEELECLEELIESVKEENRKQLAKWGIQTHTLDKWNTILAEESGETAKAILNYEGGTGDEHQIYKEAIQTATVALKIAEIALFISKKDKR